MFDKNGLFEYDYNNTLHSITELKGFTVCLMSVYRNLGRQVSDKHFLQRYF